MSPELQRLIDSVTNIRTKETNLSEERARII